MTGSARLSPVLPVAVVDCRFYTSFISKYSIWQVIWVMKKKYSESSHAEMAVPLVLLCACPL